MGSPDVVDAELASDLVVITASAFEGAEAQAEGKSVLLLLILPSHIPAVARPCGLNAFTKCGTYIAVMRVFFMSAGWLAEHVTKIHAGP